MIVLSWPPSALSPNWRGHWAVKAKAVKSYRASAGWATKASGDKVEGEGAIDVHISFYPPDKRKYDWDNLLARVKSGIDGIADGLGVNDNRFRIRFEICSVISGGEIRIIIND